MNNNKEINNLVLTYKETREDIVFEQLWNLLQSNVFAAIEGWGKSLKMSSDELQALALEKLLKLIKKFTPGKGNFTSLYKVALRNHYTDIYRKQQTRIKNGVQEIHFAEEKDFENTVYQEGAGYQDDELPNLEVIIDQLNDADRELIILRFVDDVTVVDIAYQLGISRQAVYKRLNRIYRDLKESSTILLKN